jgi:hypothetical protein
MVQRFLSMSKKLEFFDLHIEIGWGFQNFPGFSLSIKAFMISGSHGLRLFCPLVPLQFF